MAQQHLVHASVVEWLGTGLVLRGPSGRGKSDLALRLIDTGARLVADDQAELWCEADQLMARAPDSLAGLIEVRGIGIFRLPHLASSRVGLIVDLEPTAAGERLPEPRTCVILGVCLPLVMIDATAASATARLRLALTSRRVH